MTVRTQSLAGAAEIARLFRGRRRAARTDCRRPIEVWSGRRAFRGRTVNISRLGALVEIHDERFLPPGSTGSLIEVAAAVRAFFPRTLLLRFPRARVAISAAVVRVAGHPSTSAGVLGCAFATPLTRLQCRSLGVPPDRLGDARDPSDDEQPAARR